MRRLWVGVLVALALLAAGLAPSREARAAEWLFGPNPSFPAGQTLEDDLYVFGGTATIDGDVSRDLIVAGGTVTISGTVGGNLNVAGGTVTVNGPVRGTVRVAGGSLTLTAPIGWDLVVAGGNVEVGREARVGHDLVIGGGSVTVDGNVGRDIRGSAGTLSIDSTVGRNVVIDVNDRLSLGPTANITGNLDYRGPTASVAAGARVQGTTTQRQPERRSTGDAVVSWIGGLLLRLAWALVAGTALVLLLPKRVAGAASALRERPVVCVAWGAGLLLVVPLIVLVLLVTVVGVPVALILAGAYAAALYLSQVIVGIALASLVLPRSVREVARVRLWAAMLAGVTVVVLVRLLPLPYGWTFWLSLIVSVLGLGAIWTDLTGWGRWPTRAEQPAGMGPPAVETPGEG